MIRVARPRYPLTSPVPASPTGPVTLAAPSDSEFRNPAVFRRTSVPLSIAPQPGAGNFMGVGGLGGTWYSLHKLFEALEPAGIGRRLVAMAGHERGAQSDLAPLTHADWVEAIVSDAKSMGHTRPTFVGYSTSGLAGLVAEALNPGLFRALVLVAPALILRKNSQQLGIRSLDLAASRNPLLSMLCRSRSIRFGSEYTTGPAELLESPRMRRVPLSSVVELSRLQRFVVIRARHVTCPVLIVQGDQDRTVNPRGARILCAALKNADVKLLAGEGGHSVLLDRGRDRLITQTVLWLRERGLLQDDGIRVERGFPSSLDVPSSPSGSREVRWESGTDALL
jgi:pimeloyl-ACP methyl ester carboxylesterase